MHLPPCPPGWWARRPRGRLAVSSILLLVLVAGCAGARDAASKSIDERTYDSLKHALPGEVGGLPPSALRDGSEAQLPELQPVSSIEDYIRYALLNNPAVEAAYQRWRAEAERIPQVSSLPDPRVSFGYFAEEVATRVGPQEARVGVQQTFPWPGTLLGLEEAATRGAMAAWRRLEAVRLATAEEVVVALHDLDYLDRAIAITRENLDLLRSFEEVIRTRYRVGAGSHPELVRVQVELGLLEDRLAQLLALRPSHVADVNRALNRDASAPVDRAPEIPGRVASRTPENLVTTAREFNPVLRALEEEVEEQRRLEDVARREGYPDLTVGLDYIFTGSAEDRSISGSGDDPILLTFGINVPLWRGKVNAAVRESEARRLALSHTRVAEANRITAALHRVWFDHTDADRRVRLFEDTLIPKAEESLGSSLAGFRAGDTSFLDLLDTERTLLEFAISLARARAERGKALARLQTLVGQPIPTRVVGTNGTEGGR